MGTKGNKRCGIGVIDIILLVIKSTLNPKF